MHSVAVRLSTYKSPDTQTNYCLYPYRYPKVIINSGTSGSDAFWVLSGQQIIPTRHKWPQFLFFNSNILTLYKVYTYYWRKSALFPKSLIFYERYILFKNQLGVHWIKKILTLTLWFCDAKKPRYGKYNLI